MESSSRRIPHLLLATILILPTVALADPDVAAQGWTLHQKSDDEASAYSLYARPRDGSEYAEYRMELSFDAAPDEVLAAIEHNLHDPGALSAKMERVILRREGDVMVSHDTIRAPFVADRDVVLRTEIVRNATAGGHVVRWFSIEGVGPPPGESVVRMPSSRGSWTLVPRDGGTSAVYRSHAELGGFLPSAFVASQMPKEIVQQAEELRRTMRDLQLARR